MKGLRKIIYPFAPDQSGAAAVFYELGGMIIICDAGGCAGNICGFDEPRWFRQKSAIFSAGLRDMDAILGRDDLMIEKIRAASDKLDASFVAIIGTPVPATIATDYHAIRRMGEKRIGLPVVTVDTNGALLYDNGIEKAYLALFDRFAEDASEDDIIPGSVGVLGATPLDTDSLDAFAKIRQSLLDDGASLVICYGEGGSDQANGEGMSEQAAGDAVAYSGLNAFQNAGKMEKNIVTAPAGLKAARMLKERFGTPYEYADPMIDEVWEGIKAQIGGNDLCGKKILVIHQQIRANAVREKIREELGADKADQTQVKVATWFKPIRECREPGDLHIREEDEFITLFEQDFDIVIADRTFRKAARAFNGLWVELPHFAVSGDFGEETVVSPRFYGAE